MIRRLQLLGPGDRFSARRVAAAGGRVWDGLLRDNKVIPAVLAVLALLVFAWIIAGALIGGPAEEGGEKVASQAALSQSPEGPDRESAETPAPGVENRDTESYSAFEKKDPFRQVIPKADEDGGEGTNESTNGGQGGQDDQNRGDRNGGGGGGSGRDDDGGGGNGGSGGRGGNNDGGFSDQSSPGNPDFGERGGAGGGDRGGGSSGDGDRGGGSGGGLVGAAPPVRMVAQIEATTGVSSTAAET